MGGRLSARTIWAITRDGYRRVTDRIKDVIQTGGRVGFLAPVEDIILLASDGERAVIGVKMTDGAKDRCSYDA